MLKTATYYTPENSVIRVHDVSHDWDARVDRELLEVFKPHKADDEAEVRRAHNYRLLEVLHHSGFHYLMANIEDDRATRHDEFRLCGALVAREVVTDVPSSIIPPWKTTMSGVYIEKVETTDVEEENAVTACLLDRALDVRKGTKSLELEMHVTFPSSFALDAHEWHHEAAEARDTLHGAYPWLADRELSRPHLLQPSSAVPQPAAH